MVQPEDAPKIIFPCDDYLIKVVGDADATFRQFVLSVLIKYDGQLTEDSFSINVSRNSRFESLTVRMRIEREQQLSDLFQELKTDVRVRMVL